VILEDDMGLLEGIFGFLNETLSNMKEEQDNFREFSIEELCYEVERASGMKFVNCGTVLREKARQMTDRNLMKLIEKMDYQGKVKASKLLMDVYLGN
jgi:hypothetical protein